MSLNLTEISAAVNVPSPATTPESTFFACSELLHLGITQIVLIWDRKSKNGRQISDEVVHRLGAAISPLIVDSHETAQGWRFGIIAAFASSPKIKAVFIFPGDIDAGNIRVEELRPRLTEMLTVATKKTLVLGDYNSPLAAQPGRSERFKSDFDGSVVIPAVECLFPDLLCNLMALGQAKLRTEYFIVGRTVMESFDAHYRFRMGTDPTVQLILWVLETQLNEFQDIPGLRIERVHLGDMPDDNSTRKPLGQARQILRFAFQTVIDRVIHDTDHVRLMNEDVASQVMRYQELCKDVESLFASVIRAMRNNGHALEEEISPQLITNAKLGCHD